MYKNINDLMLLGWYKSITASEKCPGCMRQKVGNKFIFLYKGKIKLCGEY